MAENKKKFEQEAEAFFADKKNSDVNKVYVTSDGNLFRAEHYADNWKTQLPDRTVEVYERSQAEQSKTSNKDVNKGSDTKSQLEDKAVIRAALIKEYIELFDTKPANNIATTKLQEQIDAKKAELAKEAEKAKQEAGKA
ncbi:hypothetical protein [Sphingobacterium cavernae]|uniref:hypothetical protein n=1 Tax=Sphingobacterium cavernae TaxID=2592657 RepID=UPI00122FC104|nr:hypothetical protein [Sphingobacterium cavernae]